MRGYNIFLGLFAVTAVVAGTFVSITRAQEGQGIESLPMTGNVQHMAAADEGDDQDARSLEMSDFGNGSMFGNPQNALPVNEVNGASTSAVSSEDAPPRVLYRPFNRSRRCRVNSVLNDIEEEYLFCGDKGVTFPILISGDCPVTACILDMQTDTQKLGPIFTDK